MEIGWRQCLGWFSGKRAAPVLGIDLSADAVRVIELSAVGGRWRVECYARRMLPHGAIRDGNIVHSALVSQALLEALTESGTPVRRAALALPSGLVIRKVLRLPDDLSDEELESQVEADAEDTLPFSLDELRLDFAVIGPSADDPGKIDVMLVAARKEKIDERVSLAESVGLQAVAVDVEQQALLGAVALHDWHAANPPTLAPNHYVDQSIEQSSYVLLKLGRDASHFSVVRGGQIAFERELSLGLHKLEQEISRRPEQAAALAEAFHDVACQEIRRAMQLHASGAEHAGPETVLLAGPIDHLPMLPAVLGDRLSLSVQLANPFSAMALSPTIDEALLRADASCCLLACGLATLHATS